MVSSQLIPPTLTARRKPCLGFSQPARAPTAPSPTTKIFRALSRNHIVQLLYSQAHLLGLPLWMPMQTF
ncbi:hypothetical protein BST20_22560 [Mycobacterium branderi]|uniref:Uncharacterized protein n=1 Tax=Mycobacterium branderi TaxID=43348 RepID=A0AA91LTL0_9MYCO|nr:hypothetical protein BST20_22560 [Mycobacterium branderi]